MAVSDIKHESSIDDIVKKYYANFAILQVLLSEKGLNSNLQDVSEEFGVPARRMLSSVLIGEKELIASFHIVQVRDVYLVFLKTAVDMDIDDVHRSVKLISSLYEPEEGAGEKDFVTKHGFFRSMLTSSLSFKYRAIYRSSGSSDSVIIDYGSNMKHYTPAGTSTQTKMLRINPVAYLFLPNQERSFEYEIDGIKGYEAVVKDRGGLLSLMGNNKPVFEWWGRVPSPHGDEELTLKIDSESKGYDKNLEVWDHLIKTITVKR